MKKSREFNNVFNECLERLLVNGETIEQCLQSYPKYASELKPLLETALITQEATAIEPRPEFRDKARYQFYSALQEMEPKKSRFFFSWQPRWAMAVAAVLILLMVGSGTVYAASRSMPDDFLYPVKLATEQVQLLLTPSALGKAELYAKLADKRVVEIVRMADESKPEQIELTAQRLDAHLNKIADLADAQEVVAGEAVMAPMFEKAVVPEEAEAAVPPEEKEEEAVEEEEATPPAVTAPPAAIEVEQFMLEREMEADEVDAGVDEWSKFKETVRSDAIKNSTRLRDMLEKLSPSARPALLKAIAISETGYEKALESLD